MNFIGDSIESWRKSRPSGLHRGWWPTGEGAEANGPREAREWDGQHLLYQDPCLFVLARLQLMFTEAWLKARTLVVACSGLNPSSTTH